MPSKCLVNCYQDFSSNRRIFLGMNLLITFLLNQLLVQWDEKTMWFGIHYCKSMNNNGQNFLWEPTPCVCSYSFLFCFTRSLWWLLVWELGFRYSFHINNICNVYFVILQTSLSRVLLFWFIRHHVFWLYIVESWVKIWLCMVVIFKCSNWFLLRKSFSALSGAIPRAHPFR
jgi:hypothetical protein